MTTASQKFELSKLNILQLLSDPERLSHGATATQIRREDLVKKNIHDDRVLASMVDDGLITRGQDQQDSKAKPYFISEAGKSYLEASKKKANFPDMTQKSNWTAMISTTDAQGVIAGLLEGLPEFANSDAARIREVSNEISLQLNNIITRKR